jgi:hypothetical protein
VGQELGWPLPKYLRAISTIRVGTSLSKERQFECKAFKTLRRVNRGYSDPM